MARRRIFIERGAVFGQLTVTGFAPTGAGMRRVYVRCVCGERRAVAIYSLTRGTTTSCGCLRTALTVARSTRHGAASRGRKTAEYTAWIGLVGRVENASKAGFKNYGGRGVEVCERWRNSFAAFLADMGPRPGPGYSIERKNNGGNYEPDNCRWALQADQARNRRSTKLTVDIVRAVRAAAVSGESRRSIANRLRLNYANVCNVVAGRSWQGI